MKQDVRLQGGPFDGERERGIEDDDLPPMIWVVPCWQCGAHWFGAPLDDSEAYRRDDVDERGWLVYVWCDPKLGGLEQDEARELVPAGGVPDDQEGDGD